MAKSWSGFPGSTTINLDRRLRRRCVCPAPARRSKKSSAAMLPSSSLVVSRVVSWRLGAAAERSAHQYDVEMEDDGGIMCESCHGRGWLLCVFCKGKKTNVESDNNRMYRRCPICRATGYVLCSKCRVYKCVTFPDFSDDNESPQS